MRSGGTPNLAITPSRSSSSLLMVLTSVTRSVTSWARSLSPVEITTFMPRASAACASVPITSSASTPSIISSGQPSARTAWWIGSICKARSVGIEGRFAL